MDNFLWIFLCWRLAVESLHHSNGFTILNHCRKHHSDTSYTIRNTYTYICRFWISGEIPCLVQCCCVFAVVESDREFLKRNYAQERISLPQKKWKHNTTSLLWMLGTCPVFFHCVCIALIARVIKNICQDYVNSNWTPNWKYFHCFFTDTLSQKQLYHKITDYTLEMTLGDHLTPFPAQSRANWSQIKMLRIIWCEGISGLCAVL